MKNRLQICQVRLGPWTFIPGLYAMLSTLLLIVLFVYLGFWQIGRGTEKQHLQNKLDTRIKLAPLQEKDLFGQKLDWASLRYRQIQITGKFLNEKPIFLDNQILDGRVGYRVIMPLELADQKTIILIDRGWVPLGKTRAELPSIVPLDGPVSLMGTLNQPVSRLKLGSSSPSIEANWPLRILEIDFDTLSQQLGQKLIPVLVQLNGGSVYAFQILPISFKISAERHLGYAFQWFTLAFTVFIYFIVSNTHRSLKHV